MNIYMDDSDIQSLVRDVCSSSYFVRLHDVSFLGIIDYFRIQKETTFPPKFTRADHTYGVMELAYLVIERGDFNHEESLVIMASALCHDMGHGPFSHSLEDAFKAINPNVSHKTVLKNILSDKYTDIYKILTKYRIDPERVLSICNNTSKDKLNWIFHNPINIDTIDGIYRFYLTFKLFPSFDRIRCVEALIRAFQNNSLTREEVDELDRFWDAKSAFYEQFLTRGAFAEYEAAFIKHVTNTIKQVEDRDFFKDENEVIDHLGWERASEAFSRPQEKSQPKSRFRIIRSVTVNSLDDLRLRYVRDKDAHK